MKFERELLKGVLPVVVLEVLSRGTMYGYELGEAIQKRSKAILQPVSYTHLTLPTSDLV